MKTLPTLFTVLVAVACSSVANRAAAEQQVPPSPQAGSSQPRLGIQALGTAGLTVPAAKESFEAAGLGTRSLHLGGGGQITDIWRSLFVEVSADRWSGEGERVFLDDEGTRYQLGIPLSIKTTHIDVSAGWKARADRLTTYLGAGAGRVLYSETSPFAQSGEDVETQATSYHLLGGVEVPILRWLAIAGELRYRFVPDVLGDDGVSAVLEEDRFGGLQTGLSVRIGFGGSARPISRRPAPVPPPAPGPEAAEKDIRMQLTGPETALVLETAPVYLLPDSTRTPLRTLAPGTSLRVLLHSGEWLRVEFRDAQFGARQGYVQRKYVRMAK